MNDKNTIPFTPTSLQRLRPRDRVEWQQARSSYGKLRGSPLVQAFGAAHLEHPARPRPFRVHGAAAATPDIADKRNAETTMHAFPCACSQESARGSLDYPEPTALHAFAFVTIQTHVPAAALAVDAASAALLAIVIGPGIHPRIKSRVAFLDWLNRLDEALQERAEK